MPLLPRRALPLAAILLAAGTAFTAAAFAPAAFAQSTPAAPAGATSPGPKTASGYPAHSITMIVPFAAGGPTDTVARLLAESMAVDLGQPVVVENATGAGGTIGAQRTALARPDGYTILLHHIGMGVIPTLYRKLGYDPVNGFETIGLVTEVSMTIVARKDLPASTLPELITLMKTEGDGFNLADAGIGSSSALCGMLFSRAVGASPTVIPYRGTGPAMTELLAGHVDLLCDQTTQTSEYIRANAIKPIVATTRTRIATLPTLPTAQEAGLPEFEVTVWHGLYAPKGTSAEITTRLSQSLQKALASDRIRQRFAEIGTAPVAQDQATPAAHRVFWQADIAKWRPVIQASGQYAD